MSFDGLIKKYTTTWNAVDKDFKSDNDIGGQLKRSSFFENYLAKDITSETDDLQRAKNVYNFIQKHYSWNKKYHLFRNMNVKKAFKDGVGTVGEINMSLINALNAAGIDAKMGLLSTRKNGIPTKIHPVISDFNYLVACIELNDKILLLDATEKNTPFGVLPFRCLNRDVRIMDFKNGSYWGDVIPNKRNGKKISGLFALNENGDFEGKIRVTHNGYTAITKRATLEAYTEDEYLEQMETVNGSLIINDYTNTNFKNIDASLIEEFDLEIENDVSISDKLILYPFSFDQLTENPFKLDQRSYPVDFGYARSSEHTISIEVPDNFEIESIPKSKSLKLPENTGTLRFKVNASSYKISVYFKYELNKAYFYSHEYLALKEFYKQIILIQNQPVVLKKIVQ